MSSDNFLNIVLYQPEIPQNTGNIARLCAANKLKLHLIEPLSFEISDKYLRRAALDYWEFLDYEIYSSWDTLLAKVAASSCKLNAESVSADLLQVALRKFWFYSTKATKKFWNAGYQQGDYLVFGPETRGLPESILKLAADHALTLPMRSENVRSLNLASTVQAAYYEAFRVLEEASL